MTTGITRNTLLPAGAVLLALALSSSVPAPRVGTPLRAIELTGEITGWSVVDDGSVLVRLDGTTENGEDFSRWFVTPANQSSTTRFEDHVLEIALRNFKDGPHPATVVVRSERGDNERFGRNPADAMPLSALTRLQ